MEPAESVGQIDFLGGIQGAKRPKRQPSLHGPGHVGIAETQGAGADSKQAEIVVMAAIQVPDLTASRLPEMGGPLVWSKHFGAFAQELRAAGDAGLGVGIERLGE